MAGLYRLKVGYQHLCRQHRLSAWSNRWYLTKSCCLHSLPPQIIQRALQIFGQRTEVHSQLSLWSSHRYYQHHPWNLQTLGQNRQEECFLDQIWVPPIAFVIRLFQASQLLLWTTASHYVQWSLTRTLQSTQGQPLLLSQSWQERRRYFSQC